jgi:hypothetical protein
MNTDSPEYKRVEAAIYWIISQACHRAEKHDKQWTKDPNHFLIKYAESGIAKLESIGMVFKDTQPTPNKDMKLPEGIGAYSYIAQPPSKPIAKYPNTDKEGQPNKDIKPELLLSDEINPYWARWSAGWENIPDWERIVLKTKDTIYTETELSIVYDKGKQALLAKAPSYYEEIIASKDAEIEGHHNVSKELQTQIITITKGYEEKLRIIKSQLGQATVKENLTVQLEQARKEERNE